MAVPVEPHPQVSGAPVVAEPERTWLKTVDEVRLSAAHWRGSDRSLAYVVAHGFTGSWKRPEVVRVLERLAATGAGVLAMSFRGHGASEGGSTVGDLEVLDVDAAVGWARALGYERVVTVGFSMGGAVVVRHAGLLVDGDVTGVVDAVVSVSAPSRWFYRGTSPMRRVHWALDSRVGRRVLRHGYRTRLAPGGWEDVPIEPREAASRLPEGVPLLVVHGDADHYFPVDHGEQLAAGGAPTAQLWVEEGMGHAEGATSPELLTRIDAWARASVAAPGGREPAGG